MSQQTLRSDGRLPLYQQLADTLRQEVIDGKHRPGDRFPSENVLADDYEMATGTVRQALGQLVSEGLLERIHGRGTFVRRPNFDQSLFRFFRFRGASGESIIPESRILKRTIEVMPSYVSRQLGVDDATEGISISRLRLIDNMPVQIEEIWLPHEPFCSLMDIPLGKMGALLYPVYDAHCNKLVAQATESLTAEIASALHSRVLQVDVGTPLMIIERTAKDYSGAPLEWRRSRGRADQFQYQIEIR